MWGIGVEGITVIVVDNDRLGEIKRCGVAALYVEKESFVN